MQIARKLHTCLGLCLGIFLCVLGLSGSALVFRQELERAFFARMLVIEPGGDGASLDEMRRTVQARFSYLELYRVILPKSEVLAYEFVLGRGGRFTHRVYVNPYSRRITGVRTHDSDFFLLLQSLHFDLLANETGRKVNGVFAVGFLLLALTGVVRWFSASRPVTPRLLPRFGVRPARRNWGLHMSIGFWSFPLLMLTAVTAIYFAYHDPVARIVYALTRSEPAPSVPAVRGADNIASLDEMLRAARISEPRARFTVIRLPRATGQSVILNYSLEGDLSDLGANCIYFDGSTGAMPRKQRLSDLSIGARVLAAAVPLHFGTAGGLPTRIIWAGLGFAPGLLFVTGVSMWRRRQKQKQPSRDSTGSVQTNMEVFR